MEVQLALKSFLHRYILAWNNGMQKLVNLVIPLHIDIYSEIN